MHTFIAIEYHGNRERNHLNNNHVNNEWMQKLLNISVELYKSPHKKANKKCRTGREWLLKAFPISILRISDAYYMTVSLMAI